MFRLLRLDPPHGWRAVWWELAIVTLGVLIALGAQQLVEALNWQTRAADAKNRLLAEVQRHYDVAHEFLTVAPCIDRQLDVLAIKVVDPDGRVLVYSERDLDAYVFRMPNRSITTDVWLTAISEGVTSHLDRDFATLMLSHYGQMAQYYAIDGEGRSIDQRLAVLKRNMPLDARDRFQLVRDIEALREVSAHKRLIARQAVDRLNQAGVTTSEKYLREWLPRSGTANFCKAHGFPLDTAFAAKRAS